MICPHCNKPIHHYIQEEHKERAKELIKQGYSYRDAEKILHSEGIKISYGYINRLMKDKKNE